MEVGYWKRGRKLFGEDRISSGVEEDWTKIIVGMEKGVVFALKRAVGNRGRKRG